MNTEIISLPISQDYIPDWGIYEGLREIIQNAIDAEVQHNAKFELGYNEKKKELTVINRGVSFSKKVLVIGYSTKRDDDSTIGQFGEGFKFGLIALLRNGCDVTILTDDEEWTPYIETSEQFGGEEILKLHIEKQACKINDVVVKIRGIESENVLMIYSNFLYFSKDLNGFKEDEFKEKRYYKCGYGTLILDPNYQGRVYVKGVFVTVYPALKFGYNLADVIVDRDRKLADQYTLRSNIARALSKALCSDVVPVEFKKKLFALLSDDSGQYTISEYSCFHEIYRTYMCDSKVRNTLADIFYLIYGSDVVPLTPHEAAKHSGEMEYLGLKYITLDDAMPILVRSKSLADILKLKLLDMANSSPVELDEKEKENFDKVKHLLSEALNEDMTLSALLTGSRIVPVEFVDNTIKGMFVSSADKLRKIDRFSEWESLENSGLEGRAEKGTVLLISRKIFKDPTKLLLTITHELCHHFGTDGSIAFQEAFHSAMELITRNIISRSNFMEVV